MPHPSTFADRTAEFLIARRLPLAIIALLILLGSWPLASRLEMDRRVEQMFPDRDPAVTAYEILRNRFGGNAVAMLVYHDEELFTAAGLERVEKLANQAREIPGVKGVLSLAEVNDALSRARPGNLFGLQQSPAILDDSSLALGFRDLFVGYTHDADDHLAAIVAMLDPQHPDARGAAIESLRRIANEIPAKHQPVALVGEPVLVSEGFSLVDQDGQRLATTTSVLLGLTTLLLFRSPRWVLAELAVIVWAVGLTRATSVLLGLQLTMVSSMLTAIVTVIAVACVIHIAVRFASRRRRGDSPHQATQRALASVLPPIVWACLTDAAGFAALAISDVGPVRDFGIMMTLGTAAVLLAVPMLVPCLMLMPTRGPHTSAAPGDRWIRRRLTRLVWSLQRHRRLVGISVLLLTILTGLGLNRLRTETNFIRNFRATSDLARAYAMVETEFGGAGVWDIILPAPETLDSSYLDLVRALEADLRAIRIPANRTASQSLALTKVLSMADADATAAQSPLLAIAPPGARIAGMRVAMPTFVDALLTPGGEPGPRYLRIMLRAPERTSADSKLKLINAVSEVVERHTSTPAWKNSLGSDRAPAGQVTGYYVLLARLIESLLSDQWTCLGLATLAVYLMMAIAFRSLYTALLCMIPNLLPVLAVLGVMGLLGARVNMGAAMIAAVSIGLTIDGSIHFLASVRTSEQRGTSRQRAVLHAQRQVGLPVLLATIALALGFSVLSTSAFIPTVTFGLLVTAALLTGTLANLTLLPLLLTKAP